MKGLVKYALGSDGVKLMDLPEPVPQEGELKVKVLAAGICGSDVHAMHDQRSVNMPVVMGHEYVGEVVETCGDTGIFKVGDWVTTLPACYSCRTCELCQKGLVTLCKERKSIGSHVNGAMANYVVVPAKYSFKLPSSVKTLQEKKIYALAEPLCCVVRAVFERIEVHPKDLVVVSGPGPMGIMAAQLFKLRGAYVIVSGLPIDRKKLDLALKLGADEAVTSVEELEQAVYRKNPAGADIVCEATGIPASLNTCLHIVRTHGVHLQIGLFGKPVECRLDTLFEKEVNYVASNSTAVSSWQIGMDLLEKNAIILAPLMSLEFPLDQWQEGMDAVLSKRSYKVVLLPDNHFV